MNNKYMNSFVSSGISDPNNILSTMGTQIVAEVQNVAIAFALKNIDRRQKDKEIVRKFEEMKKSKEFLDRQANNEFLGDLMRGSKFSDIDSLTHGMSLSKPQLRAIKNGTEHYLNSQRLNFALQEKRAADALSRLNKRR